MNDAQGTSRLLMLAEALDVWPPESFNLRSFEDPDQKTVCALGLAVYIFGDEHGVAWRDGEPQTFSGGRWYHVAHKLFGVDVNEANALFNIGYGRHGHEGPREMAHVIRDFVAARTVQP